MVPTIAYPEHVFNIQVVPTTSEFKDPCTKSLFTLLESGLAHCVKLATMVSETWFIIYLRCGQTNCDIFNKPCPNKPWLKLSCHHIR